MWGSVESADAAGTRANLDLAAIEARLSRLVRASH